MEVEAETMSISVASESFVWKVLTALESNLFFSNGDVVYIYIYAFVNYILIYIDICMSIISLYNIYYIIPFKSTYLFIDIYIFKAHISTHINSLKPSPTSGFSKVRLLTLVSALSILDSVVRRNPAHSQNDLSGET